MKMTITRPEENAVMRMSLKVDRKSKAAKAELKKIAEEILAISNTIAPMDSEDLRLSGRVKSQSDDGAGIIEYVIIYLEKYAEYHEHWRNETYKNPTTPGTYPHFLKRALERFGGPAEVRRRTAYAYRSAR